jgi:hypothetical protein
MYEKVDALVKVDVSILERIERLERKVFEEPDPVAKFLKQDLEAMKRKVETEITTITRTLAEDQTSTLDNSATEKKTSPI